MVENQNDKGKEQKEFLDSISMIILNYAIILKEEKKNDSTEN